MMNHDEEVLDNILSEFQSHLLKGLYSSKDVEHIIEETKNLNRTEVLGQNRRREAKIHNPLVMFTCIIHASKV